MLSDEMTTGSVTSSEPHKRAFAARSHSWNVAQPRFREAFPEVSDLSTILSLSVPGFVSIFDPVGLVVDTLPSFLLLCNLIDMDELNTDIGFYSIVCQPCRIYPTWARKNVGSLMLPRSLSCSHRHQRRPLLPLCHYVRWQTIPHHSPLKA
jgi:hypothetical protein